MSRLEIILSAILFISTIFNVGLFIYTRNVVAKLLFVSEELGDLQNMTDALAKHLKRVYELDTFYGDETLHALLQHAVSFNEYLFTFEEIYSITEEKDDNENRTDTTDGSQGDDENQSDERPIEEQEATNTPTIG